ncbi:hypothetical protein BGP_6098 [Beggiatoa sp. PS]|nr:hypothetical protein BGP_6098 [Beggiatoa sp. PS]
MLKSDQTLNFEIHHSLPITNYQLPITHYPFPIRYINKTYIEIPMEMPLKMAIILRLLVNKIFAMYMTNTSELKKMGTTVSLKSL